MGTIAVVPASSPVQYPTVRVGGAEYQFRYTKTSQYLLEVWGFDLTPNARIPAIAWAAAMAGCADAQGNWKSAAFKSVPEFTDRIEPDEDMRPLFDAVTEALKKVAPKATVTLEATSAIEGSPQPN